MLFAGCKAPGIWSSHPVHIYNKMKSVTALPRIITTSLYDYIWNANPNLKVSISICCLPHVLGLSQESRIWESCIHPANFLMLDLLTLSNTCLHNFAVRVRTTSCSGCDFHKRYVRHWTKGLATESQCLKSCFQFLHSAQFRCCWNHKFNKQLLTIISSLFLKLSRF